jgi:hypothetical protein
VPLPLWAQTSWRPLFNAARCSLVLIIRCVWRSRATCLAEAAASGKQEDCAQNDKTNFV